MKKTFKTKLLFSVLAIGLMSGCASNAPKITEEAITYDKTMSYGKNLLLAGGLSPGTLRKMKDVEISQSDYNRLIADSSMIRSGTNAAAISATAIALDMYSAVGFVDAKSILGSADFKSMLGMGLLKGLLEPEHPSLVNHMVMWMPKEFASTKEEAQKKINDIFIKAHRNSMPDGHAIIKNPINKVNTYAVTGGICDKSFAKRNATCQGTLKEPVYVQSIPSIMTSIDLSIFQPGYRPSFIENPGKESWVIYVRHGLYRDSLSCYIFYDENASEADKAACTEFNKAYMNKLKTNLPDWVYLYRFDKKKGLGMVEQLGETRNTFPLIIAKQ